MNEIKQAIMYRNKVKCVNNEVGVYCSSNTCDYTGLMFNLCDTIYRFDPITTNDIWFYFRL